ncbi:probable cytochrome P450 313a4 [Anastrepha ludens]|uniref:probable cytochrome P450 313a4 n=1 Tax=Anastrepha ludens TaxID=28586 RepID=UPI0023AFCDDF|nr:probable cytochrome P450 313a4 [Anastrepha ludens]
MLTRSEKFDSCSCGQWRFLYLITFITVLAYFYLYLKRRRFQNITSNIPTVFGIPFIGVVYKLIPIKRFLYAISSYFEELNTSTYAVWLGISPIIITIDPEIIKTVTSSAEFLNKAETLYDPLDGAVPEGIITSKVNKWKHNRKLMNGFFNHKALMSFIPVFNRGSNIAVNRLRKMSGRGEHKLFDLIKRVILEVSIETTMGIEMKEGSTENKELVESFSIMMNRIAKVAVCSTMGLGFLARTSSYYKSIRFLRKFLNKLIEQHTDNNNTSRNSETWTDGKESMSSFLEIALNYCERGQLQREDVIIESISLIGASFETVATSIYSALLMLAMHPDVQENLFQEIYTLSPEKNMKVTYEHLKQVPYLDMVVEETLRLMPSIPVVGRETIHKTKLTSQMVLPPKMQVIIPIFSLHRSKTWWGPEAHLFNPNNFLPENIAKRHPYAYMPFSKGARNCVGWRYAEIAVRISLIALVRNLKFSTSFKYEDLHFVDHISLLYDVEPNLQVDLREI